MAFVAVKLLPASSCGVVQRPALGFGHSRRHRFDTARVALPAPLRRRLLLSLQCSAEDKPEVKPEDKPEVKPEDKPEKPEVAEKRETEANSPIEDFGGWSVDETEPEPKGSWKAAVLRLGAGIILAAGVSLVAYSYFQKQGKKFIQSPPPQTSTEESKVIKETPPPEEKSSKSSSPVADYSDDDDDVTFDDYSKQDDNEEFDDELEVDDPVDKQDDQLNVGSAGSGKKPEPAGAVKKQESAGSGKKQEPAGSVKNQGSAGSVKNQGSAGSVDKQGIPKQTYRYDAKATNEYDSDTHIRDWKVVAPAFVDRMHELALSALQSLKIVEDRVDPGALCTRRSYARWLIATSSILTRSSADKVLPAMYIDEKTELAFDDILPEDPDFAAIQGLAEAGLIPSKLSITDAQSGENEPGEVLFHPDSPLSRLDLVCWKVALHHRSLAAISKEDFQEKSGFMDVDRIESRAWPAIVSDLYSGDSSIIATAFGFTRMLQPQKPVSNGQAAVALAYGDSSEQLGDEIARLEAEKMADDAVAADAVMEARTQEEVKALFDGEIGAEKKQREKIERELEEVRTMLEKVTSERELEKEDLLKNQATAEAQSKLLLEIQQRVDEQLQSLTTLQVEVSYEKDRLEKLNAKAEEDQESVAKLKIETEAEKKSLILARLWAEEEAEKARAHHKLLDEARQRWASRGIDVTVDKSIDENNIPGPSWRFSGGNTELEKLLHRAPIQDVMDKGEDLKTKVNNTLVRYWHAISEVLSRIYHRIVEWLKAIRWRISELSQNSITSVSQGVQDTGFTIVESFRGAQSSVSGKLRGAQNSVSETFRGAQSSVSDISAGAVDGTKRLADGCRTEIGKIAQRFKRD